VKGPLNFYQPSESSDNVPVVNDDNNDPLNDSGEIIYQQQKEQPKPKRESKQAPASAKQQE